MNKKPIWAGPIKFSHMKHTQLFVRYEGNYPEPTPYFNITTEEFMAFVPLCKKYGATMRPAAGNGEFTEDLWTVLFEFRKPEDLNTIDEINAYNEQIEIQLMSFWEDILEPHILMKYLANIKEKAV